MIPDARAQASVIALSEVGTTHFFRSQYGGSTLRRRRLRSVVRLAVHFSIRGTGTRHCNCNSRNSLQRSATEPRLPLFAPSMQGPSPLMDGFSKDTTFKVCPKALEAVGTGRECALARFSCTVRRAFNPGGTK